MQIDILVPQLVLARDYHDFDEMNRIVRLLNPRLGVAEISYIGQGDYMGVIYLDQVPHVSVIRELAQQQNIDGGYISDLESETA